MSRITNNKKNKDALILAIKDFKFGYLKEKNTIHAIDGLANFKKAKTALETKLMKEDYPGQVV